MAWTTPKTWVVDAALTASDMNTYISDNLEALKDPPSDSYECNEASDYTTSSTSFVDVDSTNLALTITTTGGDVLVGFTGSCGETGGDDFMYFNIDVDGTDVADDDGLVRQKLGSNICFTYLVTGLNAGSHTFKLRWKVETGGAATLYAGAGTSKADLHPQFWAREAS